VIPSLLFILNVEGSIIWKPGFEVKSRRRATLSGFKREMCMYSWLSRGTKENPGIVLGILEEKDAITEGVALEIDSFQQVYSILYARENTPEVCYKPIIRKIILSPQTKDTKPKEVDALFFLPFPSHPQFAGNLTKQEKLNILTTSRSYISSFLFLNAHFRWCSW